MAQYKIGIDRDSCASCQQSVSDAPAMCGMDDDDEARRVLVTIAQAIRRGG